MDDTDGTGIIISDECWVRDFAIRLAQAKKRWPDKDLGNPLYLKLFYLLGREDQAEGGVHPGRSLVDR